MDDLVQWLRAQLDEDERIAREASTPSVEGWGPQPAWHAKRYPTGDRGGPRRAAVADTRFDLVASQDNPWDMDTAMAKVVHMAEHDPERVLREIDAKRRVITGLQHLFLGDDPFVSSIADDSLRALALPYAVRPGYRDAWRP